MARAALPGDRFMSTPCVLVLGPERQCDLVAKALARYAVDTWTDSPERMARDRASLRWADAIVLIDAQLPIDVEFGEQLRDLPTPKLLTTTTPLSPRDYSELIDAGFDAVLQWPSSLEVLAARVARYVHASPALTSGRAAEAPLERRELA